MNERCGKCEFGRNCINGRWCEKLKIYVEYGNVVFSESGNGYICSRKE